MNECSQPLKKGPPGTCLLSRSRLLSKAGTGHLLPHQFTPWWQGPLFNIVLGLGPSPTARKFCGEVHWAHPGVSERCLFASNPALATLPRVPSFSWASCRCEVDNQGLVHLNNRGGTFPSKGHRCGICDVQAGPTRWALSGSTALKSGDEG